MTELTKTKAELGPHLAYDHPGETELFADQENPPLRMQVSGPAAERRRALTTRTRDDRLALYGSAASAFALDWLVYDRLLPWSGIVGFVVCWFAAFLVLYVVVLRQRHGRVEIVNRLMTVLVHSGAFVVGGALALVVISTAWQGWDAVTQLNFYTQDMRFTGPLAPLSSGGVLHAIIGTLIEVAITIVITLPLGVLTAVYLNEIGGRLARVVRVVVEAMTALPDIVAGLLIYAVLLVTLGFPQSGLAAAVALSITMLPITARAAEVVLRVVPGGLREASLALGASQWRTVWLVVLPTARAGLATALILGVARGIGETAPVLLTAGAASMINANPLNNAMMSLPLYAYIMFRSSQPDDHIRGFGAATVLLVLVIALFVLARVITRRRAGR